MSYITHYDMITTTPKKKKKFYKALIVYHYVENGSRLITKLR